MNGRRILLIEDGKTSAKLASLLLRRIGCEVTWAATAAEGLRLAREEAPDLVLMDINLPDMDGFTAVRTLRQDPRAARIPVVALTADQVSNASEFEAARTAGFDRYSEKPIQEDAFRALVESALDRGTAPTSNTATPAPNPD